MFGTSIYDLWFGCRPVLLISVEIYLTGCGVSINMVTHFANVKIMEIQLSLNSQVKFTNYFLLAAEAIPTSKKAKGSI